MTDERRTTAPKPDEPLDAALAALPRADEDSRVAERLRVRAQRVLASEAALRERPLARTWERVWGRRIEPALLAGSSVYYLIWVLATVSAVAR